VRSVDLAIYADALAGEAAAIAARAERVRTRLRESVIERDASAGLPAETVIRLERLGILAERDQRALRAELRELEDDLAAVEQLQAWVEARLNQLDDAA
jgi:hypothetical protein